MKSTTRVLLILAAIFIVLGGLLTAIGLFCGGSAYIGWDKKKHRFVKIDNQKYIECEKTKLDNFKNIEIDLDDERVQFIPTDSEDYYIEYAFYAFDNDAEIYKIKDDTLKIKYTDDIYVFKFGIDFDKENDSYVKIYYPKEAQFDNININLDLGSVEMSELNCTNMTADLDTGSFEAEKCYIEKADIDLDMGSLELDHVTLGKLDANLDMGSAELRLLKDGRKSYGFDLRVDMGSIDLDSESRGSKYNCKGDNKISIDCDMGDIEIYVVPVD